MVSAYSLKKFTNGLRLITVPMDTESVSVLVMVGAGSRYEDKNESGISHFLEHMAFKGTKTRPSSREIAAAIEGVGGEFNAYTSKDHTVYWIKAAKTHIKLLLEILSHMLLESLLDSGEIEREKGVIIEEINMYEDTPMRKIGTEFEMLMYGDTPLGRDIAGTKEIIRSVIRKNFTDYMDRLYSPSNTVVAIAGGIKAAESLVEEYFGNWKKAAVSTFEKQTEKQTKPRIKVISKKTEQTHLCLGVPAIKRNDPSRYALSLLTIILGGGMSSRLFHQVRERRGLAYYIRSETNKYHDVGNFVTQAGIETSKAQEAVKVIAEEYYKLASRTEKIDKAELTRAKEFVKGHFILDLEDSQSVAELFGGSELLEGKIRTQGEIIKSFEKVTDDEIYEAARKIFKPEKMNLALIGPFEKEFEKELKKALT